MLQPKNEDVSNYINKVISYFLYNLKQVLEEGKVNIKKNVLVFTQEIIKTMKLLKDNIKTELDLQMSKDEILIQISNTSTLLFK